MENSYNYRFEKTFMFYHPHVDPLYLQLWLCTAVVYAKSSILHIWPAELGLYPGNPKWNCLNQLYELSLDNQELRRCAVPRDLNTMNRETGRCVGTHLNIVANNRPELCGWWLVCRSGGAADDPSVSQSIFTNKEKALLATRALSTRRRP